MSKQIRACLRILELDRLLQDMEALKTLRRRSIYRQGLVWTPEFYAGCVKKYERHILVTLKILQHRRMMLKRAGILAIACRAFFRL